MIIFVTHAKHGTTPASVKRNQENKPVRTIMKVTVKVKNISIEVERPAFQDYKTGSSTGSEWRKNIMNDTILPTLKEAVASAIILLNESNS